MASPYFNTRTTRNAAAKALAALGIKCFCTARNGVVNRPRDFRPSLELLFFKASHNNRRDTHSEQGGDNCYQVPVSYVPLQVSDSKYFGASLGSGLEGGHVQPSFLKVVSGHEQKGVKNAGRIYLSDLSSISKPTQLF